jgi:hypothetical protein
MAVVLPALIVVSLLAAAMGAFRYLLAETERESMASIALMILGSVMAISTLSWILWMTINRQ